jgi:hypothetical protein
LDEPPERSAASAAAQPEDAGDIANVLPARLTRATARPAGSSRTRKLRRLIAGLIPTADGPMNPQMRQALTEGKH